MFCWLAWLSVAVKVYVPEPVCGAVWLAGPEMVTVGKSC